MLDPHVGIVMFASFALVIGVVIFGGTTLAFALGERSGPPTGSAPAQHLAEQPVTEDSVDVGARREEAA